MRKKLVLVSLALAIALLGVMGCASPIATPTPPEASSALESTIPTSGEGSTLTSTERGLSNSTQNLGIWVSGEGKVSVIPDLAILTLGIESQEVTVAEAHRKAAEAMDAVVKALKDEGIDDKDIQSRFSIRQITKWIRDENREEVTGYRVTNTVTAKIREIDKVGEVIDAAALVGGDLTRISGISFSVENPTSYYTEAREKAMNDAIARATQMAVLAGVTLGKPIYISEGGSYTPWDVWYKGEGAVMAAPIPAPTPTTPISPGEQEIRLTVSMVFAIQ